MEKAVVVGEKFLRKHLILAEKMLKEYFQTGAWAGEWDYYEDEDEAELRRSYGVKLCDSPFGEVWAEGVLVARVYKDEIEEEIEDGLEIRFRAKKITVNGETFGGKTLQGIFRPDKMEWEFEVLVV